MTTIVTRAGKGEPLLNTEVDANFSNLNTDKIESVSDDTTPQLGGSLDALGNDITDVGALTADTVQLIGGTGTQGTFSWNPDEETADLIQNAATLQLGQELQIHCRNNSGSVIANGTPVMATGTLGASGRITIAPMDSTTAAYAKYYLGIATSDIPNDSDGKITTFGKVRQVNTTDTAVFTGTVTDGSVLWLDPANVGKFTVTEPTGTELNQPVAFVVSAGNNGTLFSRSTSINENAYASYAQGLLADSALQSGANISELVNDLGYVLSTEKGVANGIASLDANSLIPTNQLPSLAITTTYTVASEVAQLALTVQEGDVAVRTDLNKSYIALNGNNSAMSDWQELLSPTDAVQSVDGRTGTVTLSDLYATTAQGSLADSALQSGDNISELINDSGYLLPTAIGVTVQGYDAGLAYFAGLTFNDEATFKTATNLAVGSMAYTETSSYYTQTEVDNLISSANDNGVAMAIALG